MPLFILLALKGVTSYFLSRNPKASEYEDESIPHIDMKSEAPLWDPSETIFVEQDYVMTDFRGKVISNDTITRGQRIINSLFTSEYHAVVFTDDNNFYKTLNAKVNVAKVGASNGIHGVTLESLPHKLLVSTYAARITVQHKTQRGIRKVLHSSLSRQSNTNDQALRYNMLHHSVFTDTMQAGNFSRRGNWYAQVYSTEFGWSKEHPMKRKGDSHETLYLFFKRNGVTHKIMMYGSKEQTRG